MPKQEAPKMVGSSTLNRALDVLERLAEGPHEGMTAAQLAEATGGNRVSVHRILVAFARRGFVRQDRPGAPYRLGFGILKLADRVIQERDVVALAYPLLETLAQSTGETSHLAVLDGGEAVYVAKVESSQSIRLVSDIGGRVPLYCTALGKALLAKADEDLLERLLAQQSFEPRTPRTKTSPEELRRELITVRSRGFAIDDMENEEGVRCVSAAVLDHIGRPTAAISVSGPSSRVTKEAARTVGELVADRAATLSAALGHDAGSAEGDRVGLRG